MYFVSRGLNCQLQPAPCKYSLFKIKDANGEIIQKADPENNKILGAQYVFSHFFGNIVIKYNDGFGVNTCKRKVGGGVSECGWYKQIKGLWEFVQKHDLDKLDDISDVILMIYFVNRQNNTTKVKY